VSNFAGDLETRIRSNLTPAIQQAMTQGGTEFETPAIDQSQLVPKTSTLEYIQGGLRFTTTVGPADLGIQYYSGYLSRPAAAMNKGGYEAVQKAIADLDAAIIAVGTKNAVFEAKKADFETAQTAAEATALQVTGAEATAVALETVAATTGPNPILDYAAQQARVAADAAQALLTTTITDATTKGLAYATAGTDLQSAADTAATAQAALQAALTPEKLVSVGYNRYHQIGVDYAQVLFGFNVRAELAANITADLDGDDGLVYNPSIVWSLGFDRDLFAGINLNLQVNESVRLFDDKVGEDPLFDIEAGTDMTSTRLTASLSRSFFRNELELRGTVIWGLEDQDFYLIPAITWTRGDVTLECSAGIFAGNREGELGQYRDNAFVKTLLSYSF
jgi:hypothetical protein